MRNVARAQARREKANKAEERVKMDLTITGEEVRPNWVGPTGTTDAGNGCSWGGELEKAHPLAIQAAADGR